MNQKVIANLLSAHRLSNDALSFLERIKFQPYQLENQKRFEFISYINNQPEIIKKIIRSRYEVGFSKTYDLTVGENTSENYGYLKKINNNRKSTRNFADKPLSIEELSQFLKLFYSLTGEEDILVKREKISRKTRNIASGGGLYPTEIFLVNQRIKNLPIAAYHYNIFDFKLELIQSLEKKDELKKFHKILMKTKEYSLPMDIEKASSILLFTSILNKHTFKYKDFGLALAFIEIGEFIHAAYLAASALNLACCPFGGILNEYMHDFLDLRNPLHYPIMAMTIGKSKL